MTSDIKKLDEILIWLRFMSIPKVYKALEDNLDTDDKKLAYDMSDGETTTRKIANIITPAHSTIADWWKEWYKVGIAEAVGVQRGKRAKKIFDLEDFGIDVPSRVAKLITNEKDEVKGS